MTSSYFFFYVFLLFVLSSLLCLQRLPSNTCTSSSCSLLLYRAMCVSFHCCRSLAHIDIVIQHNEKEKEERSFVRSLHQLFFHQSIFLSHQSITTTTAPPHHTAVNRGHCICVYTTHHSTNRNNRFFLYTLQRKKRKRHRRRGHEDYTGNSIAAMQANKLNAVFFS